MKKRRFNIYRDGFVHVMARMCATCIYRKDSVNFRTPIKAEAVADGTGVVCHKTLDVKPQANAVCAGFMAHDKTPVLVIAEAMGAIRKVEP
jgi:hypothetical protein